MQRTFQGHTDTDITELGRRQLACLEQRFKEIKIDAAYSSPLKRALKTAQAAVYGKNIEIIPHRGLIELGGGVFEEMSFTKIFEEYTELEYIWELRPHEFCAPEGEPMAELYDRIWQAVLEIAKENGGKTVAVATHGGAIRCLLCRILKGNIEQLIEIPWSDNTAVTKLIFDDSFACSVEFLGDTSHLSEELLPADHKISSEISNQQKDGE